MKSFVIGIALLVVNSAGAVNCSYALSNMLIPNEKLVSVLKKEDIAEIKQLLARNSKDTEELYQKIAAVVVRANERTMSPKQLALFRNMGGDTPVKDGNIVHWDTMGIVAPQNVRATALIPGFKAHESSHVNRFAKLEGTKARIMFVIRKFFDPTFLIKEEKQAMFAEWDLMRHIPRSRRLAALKQLQSHYEKVEADGGPINIMTIKILRSIVEDADLSFENYLKKQYSIGRYNIADTAYITGPKIAIAGAVSFGLIKLLEYSGHLLFGFACAGVEDDDKRLASANIYRICPN